MPKNFNFVEEDVFEIHQISGSRDFKCFSELNINLKHQRELFLYMRLLFRRIVHIAMRLPDLNWTQQCIFTQFLLVNIVR